MVGVDSDCHCTHITIQTNALKGIEEFPKRVGSMEFLLQVQLQKKQQGAPSRFLEHSEPKTPTMLFRAECDVFFVVLIQCTALLDMLLHYS